MSMTYSYFEVSVRDPFSSRLLLLYIYMCMRNNYWTCFILFFVCLSCNVLQVYISGPILVFFFFV